MDPVIIALVAITAIVVLATFLTGRLQGNTALARARRDWPTFIPAIAGMFIVGYGYLYGGIVCQIVIYASLGLYASLFALPLTGLVEELTIQPGKPGGFFTNMKQGRIKLIVTRGGRIVRPIMDNPGHLHLGERLGNSHLRRDPHKRWTVAVSQPNLLDEDSHPVPFPRLAGGMLYRALFFGVNIAWWAWKRYMYWWDGFVWIGPRFFRQILAYPMPRGLLVTRQTDKGPVVDVEPKEDISDHFRPETFTMSLKILRVTTQDNIDVDVIISVPALTVNAYSAEVRGDHKWPERFAGDIRNAVNIFARFNPVAEVLAAKGQGIIAGAGDDKGSANMAKFVARIGYSKEYGELNNLPQPNKTWLTNDKDDIGAFGSDGLATTYGIVTPRTEDGEFILPQIWDVSPSRDEVGVQLGAPAIAETEERAGIHRANIPAAFIRAEGKAIKELEDSGIGLPLAELRTRVDTVRAVPPGSTVLTNTGGAPASAAPDPVQAKILDTLQRLLQATQNRTNSGGDNTSQ